MILLDRKMLYSIVLEFQALHNIILPQTTGHLAHAMFLNLIKRFDPVFSAQLHDEPGSRPFTLSQLQGAQTQKDYFVLKQGQLCSLRLTLLNGDLLWQRLSTYFLEAGTIRVHLGKAELTLRRMLSTHSSDQTGWVHSTDWQTLVSLPVASTITIHFASPTAFSISMGKREFALVPKPRLLWESLLRAWNINAPPDYQFKRTLVSENIVRQIKVMQCDLHTDTLYYNKYVQKGFIGTCTYQIPVHEEAASSLITLAAFAYYAGVGYKTTMGMGQAKALFNIAPGRS